MTQRIDLFTPRIDDTALLSESATCFVINNTHHIETETPFIPLERNLSTEKLSRIAEQCTTDYLLLYTHDGDLRIGYRAIERMLRTAIESSADWVYSHRHVVKQGETLAVPTNEYQEGSVRDDFDFGPLVLIRTEAVREFLATNPEEMNHAALYQLRLHISRMGRALLFA